ncbi:dienelactone hydrolase family protein [Agromyces sp. SYSU K20354]|uniref:dienelactone hydrolase family protein n=1 Tax=Agromyces cavernae TaxID=2898659 RepID=UPI001E34C13D|nr:dienelactone hydrolase family protein [Agromyces cavernae]MCD2441141.1 dienelactone hydrolase family protein [Agromyces cavernae]
MATERAAKASEVEVPHEGIHLGATLHVPAQTRAFVVFAHGSGSSRHSRRNRYVADMLHDVRIGTLLLDLLLPAEELDRANVFDIPLLGRRLVSAVRWLRTRPEAAELPVGFFGASTGAGAALWAAAEPGAGIGAVVSRGGRPDLAGHRLELVTAPTLLIVGGADRQVLELNRVALAQLRCPVELTVVPGATHLFEEAGALEHVAEVARDWFLSRLIEH